MGGGVIIRVRRLIEGRLLFEKIIYGTMYPNFQRYSKHLFLQKLFEEIFIIINFFSFLYQESNCVLLFINIFSNLPVTFSVVIYEIQVKPFQRRSHCLRLQMWRLDHDFTFKEGALMSHYLR